MWYWWKVSRDLATLIADAEYRRAGREPAQLVLSPTSSPRMTILYRTLPKTLHDGDMGPADRALRPDLHLARNDAVVRKVAELARWVAAWVGGTL